MLGRSIAKEIYSRQCNWEKSKNVHHTKCIFIISLLLSAQMALAMDEPKKQYVFKSVLVPFLAFPEYFSLADLDAKDPGALLEAKVKSIGLLPSYILASEHRVILELGETPSLWPVTFKHHEILQMIKSAIWCDISHKNKEHLVPSLEDIATKIETLEQYDFLKFWLLEKRAIETEYRVFIAHTYENNLSYSGIPLEGFPHLLKLTTFLPYDQNLNTMDPSSQIPLNINNTHEYLVRTKECLKDKKSYNIFCASIEDMTVFVAKQLHDSAFDPYLTGLLSRFKLEAKEVAVNKEIIKTAAKSKFFKRK